MTSNWYISAFLAAIVFCDQQAAGMEVPALVSTYYEMRLKDEPSGVYEWPEHDMLFVKSCVPTDNADALTEFGAEALAQEHGLLFAYLAKQASRQVEDTELAPGYAYMRDFVRRQEPLWEYQADWDGEFSGPQIVRHTADHYVSCSVYSRSEVLKTMPKAFLRATTKDVWEKGAKILVHEKYASASDRSFMWRLGVLDGLELMLDPGETLEKWVEDYGSQDNARYREFVNFAHSRDEYLANGEFPRRIAAEKLRRETLPDKITFVKDAKPLAGRDEFCLKAVTNQIDELEFEIVETRVQSKTYAYHKIVTKMAVDPKFEKIFLSGGILDNSLMTRLESGIKAEKAFYAKSSLSSAQRENLIIEALQKNPADFVLWNLLGRLRMNAADYQGAVICFRAALRLNIKYEFAVTNLAVAYKKAGYRSLAYSSAIAALGIAKDTWCLKEATKILSE